jgi:hypothetical protein
MSRLSTFLVSILNFAFYEETHSNLSPFSILSLFSYHVLLCTTVTAVLLSSVGQEDQVQVMHALLHGFSLQLPCRRVLYVELITLLQPIPLSTCDKNEKNNENSQIYNREGCWSDQTEGSRVVLSSQLLSTLTQRVHARLSSFLMPAKCSMKKSKNSVQHDTFLNGAEGRNKNSRATLSSNENDADSGSSIPLTISSTQCIQSFRTLRGKEFCLAEDFSLLITLSYALEVYSNRTRITSDIVQLSKNMLGFESLHATFDNSHEGNESWIAPWESREGTRDFGSTYFFLSALTRFCAAGFCSPSAPLGEEDIGTKEATADPGSNYLLNSNADSSSSSNSSSSSSSSRIDTGGRSFNLDVPLYSATAFPSTTSTALSLVQSNQRKSDDIDKKQSMIIKENEGLQNRLTHIACCYSLLSGYLRCFISTLQFLREHAHPVRYECSNIAAGDDDDNNTSTSTSPSSTTPASNIACKYILNYTSSCNSYFLIVTHDHTYQTWFSLITFLPHFNVYAVFLTGLRHAIAHVQGLLDVLLEVSMDTSTVIPSQGPGSANSMKSSSSHALNVVPVPVPAVGISIEGHASLSASVTERLVGMSSLALSESRSVSKNAQKPLNADSCLDAGTSLPLCVDASLLLIEGALDLFTVKPVSDVTLNGGSNIDIECTSHTQYNPSRLLEREQELCDAVPLQTQHHPSISNSNSSLRHPTPTPPPALPPTPLHALPLSARLGALGHACHQASVTATSLLSIPEHQSTTSHSSCQRDLGLLLMCVFRAHKMVGSIVVEDDFLLEASEVAEVMLRRQSLRGSDTRATTTYGSSTDIGNSIKYRRRTIDVETDLGSRHSTNSSIALERGETVSGGLHTTHSRASSYSSSHDASLSQRDQLRSSRNFAGNQATSSSRVFDEQEEKDMDSEKGEMKSSDSKHDSGYNRKMSSGSTYMNMDRDRGLQGVPYCPSSSASSSSARRGHDVMQSFGCGSSGVSMSGSSTRNSTSHSASDGPSNSQHTQRWSDDSSEESYDSDVIDNNTHTAQHSTSQRQPNDPFLNDPFSLSVRHFPDVWNGSVDRYDVPCSAIEDHFEEYENAVSGTY